MVSKNENKGLFLGIAAATALVGAALLYHFVFDDDAETEATGIMAELTAAGLEEVKKAANGQGLDPQYLIKLLNFVSKAAKQRRSVERKAAIDERRDHYKNEQWDAYRNIIKEQFMAEDAMCQVVMNEMLEVLTDMSQQEFQGTMQMMAQNPQYAQMLQAAQMGKLPDEEGPEKKAAPKLEKSKTLKAFQTSKLLSMDAMKKQMMQQRQASQGGPMDEMEMMIDMFTDQAKTEDALFIKEGVENDDIEHAIMHFLEKKDPEVMKAMMAYQMEMQQEMQKHGGGMGMPGM